MTKEDRLTGVKCFSIAGRMAETRQRCLGMTDEERRWRAQWIKDQVLSPDEPRFVPEYYKETNNIIRRICRAPMDKFQQLLKLSMGVDGAYLMRHGISKFLIGVSIIYIGTYFFKYHTNDFTSDRHVELIRGREKIYPFHPNFPNYPVAEKPSDYYDQGFYSSVLCQDVVIEDIPPPAPPPPPPPPTLEEPVVCLALEKED